MAVDPSVESHVPAPSAASVSGWRWRVLHLVWRSLWAAFLVAWVLTMLHSVVGVPLPGVLEQVRRLALVLSLPAWLSPIARYLGVDRELLSRSLRFWGGRLAFGGAILIWLGLVIAVTLLISRVANVDSNNVVQKSRRRAKLILRLLRSSIADESIRTDSVPSGGSSCSM